MALNGLTPAERNRRVQQGRNLAALREERTGLSPEQFGAQIGVAGQTIRNLESGRGRPHVRVKSAIAAGLEMPMATIFPPERKRTAVPA
jgi:DNA-binding XRE family transcriptional regulator